MFVARDPLLLEKSPTFVSDQRRPKAARGKATTNMQKIQANPGGTRFLEVAEESLATIRKYGLFDHLIDSNGIVDETVLDKLKLNIRSLMANAQGDYRDLLDLCINLVYHDNMKAFGLSRLIEAYNQWLSTQSPSSADDEPTSTTDSPTSLA